MDPVTIGALFAAVAGGVGGALGSQVWAGISALARRPFRRDHAAAVTMAAPGGEAELAALEQAPADHRRGKVLGEVLGARADAGGGFRVALQVWWAQARQIEVGGEVTRTIVAGAGSPAGRVVARAG